MPETGNNIENKEKILSIRLSPDGLSFWLEDSVIPEDFGNEDMAVFTNREETEINVPFDQSLDMKSNLQRFRGCYEELVKALLLDNPTKKLVYLDSRKTVIIPKDIFNENAIGEYLDANGISIGSSEQADVSKAIHGTVAVIVSNKESLRYLGEELGEFTIASPFQYNLMRNYQPDCDLKRYCRFYTGSREIYITCFEKEIAKKEELIFGEILPYSSEADILYYMQWVKAHLGISHFSFRGLNVPKYTGLISGNYKEIGCGL